jgi:hypothetical protein
MKTSEFHILRKPPKRTEWNLNISFIAGGSVSSEIFHLLVQRELWTPKTGGGTKGCRLFKHDLS